MRYKLCKFCENRAGEWDTPLRGVYIPHFGQIWVKISILGVLHPCRCTDGGEIWRWGGDFGPLLHAKFHPHRCKVSPLRGEKPQNRPLSKLNTSIRLALRSMLPVINQLINHFFIKAYDKPHMPHVLDARQRWHLTEHVGLLLTCSWLFSACWPSWPFSWPRKLLCWHVTSYMLVVIN